MGPTAMHMSPYCVNVLISLVQSGSQPMESVFETFTNHFQAPGARFQARCLYAYLLKQNVLEDVRERIAAIFILRHGYLCELPSFPFLHVFLQVWLGSGSAHALLYDFQLHALDHNGSRSLVCLRQYLPAHLFAAG